MNLDDDLTPEEQNAAYLKAHPAYELSLWMEWVGVVCGWEKIAPPTAREWDVLTAAFSHGKMPVTSVAELKAMRSASQP